MAAKSRPHTGRVQPVDGGEEEADDRIEKRWRLGIEMITAVTRILIVIIDLFNGSGGLT